MNEQNSSRLSPVDIAICVAVGLFLALTQLSYYFLLEVELSSRATTYFLALFFWLIGLLTGLQLRGTYRYGMTVMASVGCYYAARLIVVAFPYDLRWLPVIGVCIAVSGVAAGAFFTWGRERFGAARGYFFHENNGFLVGIALTWFASLFAGGMLLDFGPLVGAIAVSAALLAARPRAIAPTSPGS